MPFNASYLKIQRKQTYHNLDNFVPSFSQINHVKLRRRSFTYVLRKYLINHRVNNQLVFCEWTCTKFGEFIRAKLGTKLPIIVVTLFVLI